MERVAGKLDQDAAGNEILRTSGGRSVAGRPFWRRGAWLATVWVLGQRRWLEALGTGKGGQEVGGREQEQKEEVTLEDVCRLAVELSEINNQRSCEISELLNDTKNLLNSWTANQTSDDEEPPREPLKLAKLCKHFLFPFFSFFKFFKIVRIPHTIRNYLK